MKRTIYRIAIIINLVAALALALGIAGLLWYSPESGWCWGTLAQCVNR